MSRSLFQWMKIVKKTHLISSFWLSLTIKFENKYFSAISGTKWVSNGQTPWTSDWITISNPLVSPATFNVLSLHSSRFPIKCRHDSPQIFSVFFINESPDETYLYLVKVWHCIGSSSLLWLDAGYVFILMGLGNILFTPRSAYAFPSNWVTFFQRKFDQTGTKLQRDSTPTARSCRRTGPERACKPCTGRGKWGTLLCFIQRVCRLWLPGKIGVT